MARCGAKAAAALGFPFGEETAVFKVSGRIFALCALQGEPPQVSLKCDPDLATHLRATYAAVQPGYHLNKRHWNTVTLDGSIDDDELDEMVDHSYDLVVAGLPRQARSAILADGADSFS